MEQNQWEILILKPTSVFLSFLTSQLPEDIELPDLALLQTDTTAYRISKCANEEDTLSIIEENYAKIFRHEIQRWLGQDASCEIEGSFLDFLCCFKFEMHSQIVLMESDIDNAKQLIRIKPRTVMLKWIKSTASTQDEDISVVLDKINVANLSENATIIIKNFDELTEVKPFLQDYWDPIYKAEMLRMCNDPEQWPEINSFETFTKYFAADIHTNLIHLH